MNACKVMGAALLGASMAAAGPVFAQSSVTLYGVIDSGVGYQSSQATLGSTTGGKSVVKFNAGVWSGSQFGLTGAEDLGGGTKAIFKLESGFNSGTGGQQFANVMFGRAAWVGVTNPVYGTFTLGRVYTSYYTMLSPWSPTAYLTGFSGAHPGDLDSLDTAYRSNNSLVYTTPTWGGLTMSGSYSLGGVPGSFNRGSTMSAGVQYRTGGFGIAAGIQRINNSTLGGGAWGANSTAFAGGQPGVSAVTNGYQTAQGQQRIAVTGGYHISSSWDVSAAYSNVQYIPGIGSKFTDKAIFNTAGAVLHWKPSVVWDVAGGYSYTRASKANGIANTAQYQQLSLAQYYSLSKRTGIYLLEAYQRAKGDTLGTNGAGNIISATATIGDGMNGVPSSTRSQAIAHLGFIHRF